MQIAISTSPSAATYRAQAAKQSAAARKSTEEAKESAAAESKENESSESKGGLNIQA